MQDRFAMLRGINFLMAVLIGMCSGVVQASTSELEALSFIEPRVERTALSVLLDELAVEDNQRMIADFVYSDYAMALEELAIAAESRADEAGRQRVRDAMSGETVLDPFELRRLRTDVLRSYTKSWPEADALFDRFVEDLRALFADQTGSRFEPAINAFRRTTLLSLWRTGERAEEYAGEGIDVTTLLNDAALPGAELAELEPSVFDALRQQYTAELDTMLTAMFPEHRQLRMDREIARIERDRSALQDAEAQRVAHWKSMFELHQRTVHAIGDLAAQHAGTETQELWLQRFDRACFPWLYTTSKPERAQHWIARHNFDDAVRSDTADIVGSFQTELERIRREMIVLMLRGRMTTKTVVHPRMDATLLVDSDSRSLYQKLLRLSGERSRLESEACAGVEALVPAARRAQMWADIAAAAYGRR